MPAQQSGQKIQPDLMPVPGVHEPPDDNVHLPSGKLQRDEILKADYEQNLKDARSLIEAAKALESDLEKSGPSVLSLGLMKKLDDLEKITRRIRNRMRH